MTRSGRKCWPVYCGITWTAAGLDLIVQQMRGEVQHRKPGIPTPPRHFDGLLAQQGTYAVKTLDRKPAWSGEHSLMNRYMGLPLSSRNGELTPRLKEHAEKCRQVAEEWAGIAQEAEEVYQRHLAILSTQSQEYPGIGGSQLFGSRRGSGSRGPFACGVRSRLLILLSSLARPFSEGRAILVLIQAFPMPLPQKRTGSAPRTTPIWFIPLLFQPPRRVPGHAFLELHRAFCAAERFSALSVIFYY